MNDVNHLVAMVVEDSVVQRNHLVSLLQDLCFGTVLEACDGTDALRLLGTLTTEKIFLLITDIDMPGMDGFELITHLAESRRVENLIVTSARDPRLLETVESLGADNARMNLLGTLPKPITGPALARLLEAARHRQADAVKAAPAAMQELAEIELALDSGQFVPFFQPKIAMATGLLKGVEALARWRHPQRGLLGPAAFIGTIEGTPLMAHFTLVMVELSLKVFVEWQKSMPSLTLSLNLSADDLSDQGFVDRLMGLVKVYEVEPSALIWEVTETMVMNPQALANLARLGLKGFGLSMDDFGIGYSSMQTLSRSPFTELKIDRIFVNGASERSNRRAILSSSLEMGRSLGVSTVAEGVETVEDWNLVRSLGCDIAQGYLIAKPMPGEELMSWTRTNRARLRGLAQAVGVS
ncbi:EAL domain-containing response regulator [Rhodoferax sp. AJA081-3]|uniref:EAL domain-containing response regulator n=1 Tax=Rhodoferax sp. AJA081-3 TaxID=2752316 RepID=UPI001AE01D11|nr:EAL domain-containing response regulator [Rhodoferax sp. AJA081-3]QTN28965.1 EAL domain-containing response regulator [Rhodoferax sp. AJA081-3]